VGGSSSRSSRDLLREQLAEGLIDAVVGVKGESFRAETEVLIAEVPVGSWYERGVKIVPEGVGK
jgi:phenylpyruvate tautomerase PptA (4-oxalocrotonate tautomerase family)